MEGSLSTAPRTLTILVTQCNCCKWGGRGGQGIGLTDSLGPLYTLKVGERIHLVSVLGIDTFPGAWSPAQFPANLNLRALPKGWDLTPNLMS
jgi:hypothetical protein